MAEISLSDILLARDERVRLQAEIITRFSCPIISFTMNIAGPIKNSAVILRAFLLGLAYLDQTVDSDKIIYRHISTESATGPLAIYAVNSSADELKRICVKAEEKTALGRLFDMDIIDTDMRKLTRARERGCIVCGAPGRACAAGRIHPVSEIVAKMNSIMSDALFKNDTEQIARLAKESLIAEVKTTPKPGLVDLRNCGSHKDMTPATFEKSADALFDFFKRSIAIGQNTKNLSHELTFNDLRKAGISAEEQMLNATSGVNTHKGAIFSFGILCGSIGRLWSPEKPIASIDLILAEAAEIAKTAIRSDLTTPRENTAGVRMYMKTGATGIRGEAASGFESVKSNSLPIYRELIASGLSKNDAGAVALLHLIASVDDTAIYNRGGCKGLDFAKRYAKDILDRKKIPQITEIEEMDDIFIQKNLSAGGSADLLAITYFLYEISELSASMNQ